MGKVVNITLNKTASVWRTVGSTTLYEAASRVGTVASNTLYKATSFINTAVFLSIFTGSLIHGHYTRECEFGNFDKKIKNKKHKKTKQHKTTQKLMAEFLFK